MTDQALEPGQPDAAAGLRHALTERPCACADRRELSCPAHGDHCCFSCGHEIGTWHQPDGCWHTTLIGKPGANLVCPCAVPWNRARQVTNPGPGHSYSIEWEGDDVPDVLIDCGGGMQIPLRELAGDGDGRHGTE